MQSVPIKQGASSAGAHSFNPASINIHTIDGHIKIYVYGQRDTCQVIIRMGRGDARALAIALLQEAL